MLRAAAAWVIFTAYSVKGVRPSSKDHVTSDVTLPRNCDNTFSGSKCCGCGAPKEAIGHRARDRWMLETFQTYGYVDKMCSRKGKPDDLKICCPLWAVDCEEEDYSFEQGLERDCAPPSNQCKYYECRGVTDLLNHMKDAYQKKELGPDVPDTLEERLHQESQASITGHSTFCNCACGELMDEDKLTCKALNTSFFCSNVRPCCRRPSEDCAKDNPWPKEVRSQTKEVSKAQHVDAAERKFVGMMMKSLQSLQRKCMKSCDTLRKSECVKDLRTVVKKVRFGKDVTTQSMLEEARFKMLLAYNKDHPAEAAWESSTQRVFDGFSVELDKAREEETREKNKYRKTHQLVRLKEMEMSKDALNKGGCCACEAPVPDKDPVMGKYPMVTSFCAASECHAYMGFNGKPACYEVPEVFCGTQKEACPSDPSTPLRAHESDDPDVSQGQNSF